jgi:hypothetical protein
MSCRARKAWRAGALDSARGSPYLSGAYWHSANKTANALQYNDFLSNGNAASRAATRVNNGEA